MALNRNLSRLIVSLSVVLSNLSAVHAVTSKDHVENAKKLIGTGSIGSIIGELNEALKIDPKNVDALQLRSWFLGSVNKMDAAQADVERAIKLAPNKYENYTTRAIIERNLQKYDEARKDLTTAIKIDPRRPEAYYLRGLTCMLQGLHVRARQDFSDVLKNTTDKRYLGFAHYWRGRTEEMGGDFKAAVDDFNKSIAIAPSMRVEFLADTPSSTTADISRLYRDRTNKELKTPHLGMLERGLSYSQMGEYQKAIDDLTVIIKETPKESLLVEKRGNAYLGLGKYQEALRDFNKALLLGAQSSDVYFRLALAHYCLKKYDSASQDMQAWFERTFWNDGKSVFALCLYNVALRRSGKDAQADSLVKLAQTKLTKEHGWNKTVVALLNNKADAKKLIELTEKVSNKEKTQARCYAALYLLVQKGRQSEALQYFDWIRTKGDKSLDEYTVAIFEVSEARASK